MLLYKLKSLAVDELRWWAAKIAKSTVIARDNHHHAIGNRHHITNLSKARGLLGGDLTRVTEPP